MQRSTPVKAAFFDPEIEPEAKCRNCDYFDGGGLTQQGTHVSEKQGLCINTHSPFVVTSGDKTCRKFWPCSKRWPDCDHD